MNDGQRIGEFSVQRELSAGRSYLAAAESGRLVVLKRLDADCLLGGQLHPLIKDRLARVRELAHLGVANLLSVQRAGEETFLVWEYVEGTSLEEQLESAKRPAKALGPLARELALHVETLHALGIVHGELHPRNVIVTCGGNLRLTHVSPLLYQDQQVDIDALEQILAEMGFERPGGDSARPVALRELITRNAADAQASVQMSGDSSGESGIRRLAVLGAILVALLGVAVACGVWRWIAVHHAPAASTDYR